MKIYQKMKAVVVDLSEVLDEAVSFNAYASRAKAKPQLAYVHADSFGGIGVSQSPDYTAHDAPVPIDDAGGYPDVNRYTKVINS